jgi:phosphoglycerate dehydrogenase-like enzyme
VPHIVIDVSIASKHDAALNKLRAIPDTTIDFVESESAPVPANRLEESDVLFGDFGTSEIEGLKRLSWIQAASVDYSHLYGLPPEHRIRVSNARGVFNITIAEWAIAMMINLARDMPTMFRNQQERRWDRDARFQSEIRGATLGIYGYGGIGRETARVSQPFNLKIWVLERGPIRSDERTYRVPGTGDPEGRLPQRVFSLDEKFEFFAGLDFLLLSLPLTPKTEGIIGAKELQALPPSACILNPARGPLIQEHALIEALEHRIFKAIALDTHYAYPLPPEHPLWAMDNVILTPHISGSTGSPHYVSRLWDLFTQNVERFVKGERLWNELTPEELSGG